MLMIRHIPFRLFLFLLLLPTKIFAQTNAEWEQDSILLKTAFNTIPRTTVDSAIVNVALFFLNTPYVANTLEVSEEENLLVNLREMDCTTFVENCLALARALQYPSPDTDYFKRELRQIRYRKGIINGYVSRLHYTSDWMFDNVEKGLIENVTYALGGYKWNPEVSFMSQNADKYPRLKSSPENVQSIEAIEKEINARKNYYYIPKAEVIKQQSLIKNGDIICFTTSVAGLDISHLGIAYRHKGQLTFIHASSKTKKVIVNPESLTDYCLMIKTNTGIVVLRPSASFADPN
jgi:hypothetical protein